MEHPELIIDGDTDVWALEHDLNTDDDPWYRNYIHGSERLSILIKNYGPVHVLAKTKELASPFKPISSGTWVQFDRNILPPTVSAMTHDYDNDKLFYRVLVTVPREEVREEL